MKRRLTERSINPFDFHRGELAHERHRLAEAIARALEA
jgi:hypothetical protein